MFALPLKEFACIQNIADGRDGMGMLPTGYVYTQFSLVYLICYLASILSAGTWPELPTSTHFFLIIISFSSVCFS